MIWASDKGSGIVGRLRLSCARVPGLGNVRWNSRTSESAIWTGVTQHPTDQNICAGCLPCLLPKLWLAVVLSARMR